MFLLGLLAVFQVTLLPGLLLIKLFKSKLSAIQWLSFVFVLSLLANYVGVLALTSMQLYRRSVSMGILLLEVIALFWLYRGSKNFSFSASVQKASRSILLSTRAFMQSWRDYWAMLGRVMDGKGKKDEDFRAIVIGKMAFLSLLLAAISLGWALYLLLANIGTVFNAWDAWASWDPWAYDWYRNRFARNTWEYPQLIPINWSITYRFIGTEVVKFFAKGIMPLFTLMMLALAFDLGRIRKAYGYYLGTAISFYAIYAFTGEYIGEGYVDLPVASLSFLAIVSLLFAQDAKDWAAKKEILILGSLVSAAAAVTKQPGLAILAAYPIMTYFLVLKDEKALSSKEKFWHLIWTSGMALIIVLPWYLYTVLLIRAGEFSSNIQYVITDIYEGASILERLQNSWTALGSYAYLYLLLLFTLPFMDRAFKWITLALVYPYSILWGMFLSYEFRNLAIVFPLMGIALGVGFQQWLAGVNIARIRKAILQLMPLMLLLGLLWGARTFTSHYLVKLQVDGERKIFNSEINRKLFIYFGNHGGPGVVLSPYPLGWLPGLNSFWVNTRFADYDAYQATLIETSEIEYLLIFDRADELIYSEVLRRIESGEYDRLFVEGEYMFVDLDPD